MCLFFTRRHHIDYALEVSQARDGSRAQEQLHLIAVEEAKIEEAGSHSMLNKRQVPTGAYPRFVIALLWDLIFLPGG